jgi:4-hydroxybenzoyl-CoA reductase subunit beta
MTATQALHPFTLARPRTVADAVALLAATPGARIVAGGTDLVPNLRDGLGAPDALVDVTSIGELRALALGADGATIGAGVTLARLAADEALASRYPAIGQAAASVAGPAHRTVATLGGNLCLDTRCVYYNQSEWWRRSNAYCLKHGGDTCHVAPQGRRCHAAFSGDLAPALLVLDAEASIAGRAGTRVVPLEALYADDGAAHLTLARDEVLASVRIPVQPAGAVSGYRKARAREAIDFPLAGAAVRIAMREGAVADLRVALTGTNSRPFVLDGTDALAGRPLDDALRAALVQLVRRQTHPMRTTVTASNYRRQVAAVLVRRLVDALADGSH